MGLRNYKPRRTTIPFGDEALSVRGLSLTDVAVLVGDHLNDIDTLMKAYEQQTDDIFANEAGNILIQMLATDAPELIGKIIALASDEASNDEELAELADVAAKLPFTTQIAATMAIAKHTFEDAGGPKEFFRSLGALRGIGTTMIPKKTT